MEIMEKFDDAAYRHFRDAQYLEKGGRMENASLGYGLAAECGIKHAMVGNLVKIPRDHIDDLWDKAPFHSKFNRIYPGLVQCLRSANPFPKPFMSKRYETNGTITVKMARQHGQVAQKILGLVGLTGERP